MPAVKMAAYGWNGAYKVTMKEPASLWKADHDGQNGMRVFVLKFWTDDSGATAIEYALLASGIAVTLLGGIASIAGGINGVMTTVGGNL